MLKLYLYCMLATLTGVALSAYIQTHKENDKIEYCEIDGLKIREGEKASLPGKCQQVKCVRASTKRFTILGCSMFVLNPECPLSELDYSKPYPLCCPHSVCSVSSRGV